MRCEQCNKYIWFWNKWRNRRMIVVDPKHHKYMLSIQWCSEKCYFEYSRKYLWLIGARKVGGDLK